jgi:hypothetical protein
LFLIFNRSPLFSFLYHYNLKATGNKDN